MPEWRDSTGSIYPAIERLVSRGLISVSPRAGDRRGRRDLSVTLSGADAVRSWLVNLDPCEAKVSPDPIRTRVSFLDQLVSNSERVAVVAEAEALTQASLTELRCEVEALKATHTSEYLAGLGTVRQFEARRSWLEDVRSHYFS